MVVSLPLVADPYVIVGIVFGALSVIAVLGRLYVRAFLLRAWGHDDSACLVTLILSAAYYVCILALWRISGLRAVSDIPRENVEPAVNLVFASLLFYILAAMALKVALGLLLLRVLVKPTMRIVIHVVIAVSVVYGVAYFFLAESEARANLKVQIFSGKCLAKSTVEGMAYTHAALTSLADVIFAILPVVYLWTAPLPRRIKISVGGILVLGSAYVYQVALANIQSGCVASFVRLGWVSNLTTAVNTFVITSRGIALMSAIELAIGLICISLATYKPLFRRYFARSTSYNSVEESPAGSNPNEIALIQKPSTLDPKAAHVTSSIRYV